jgi:hypothetical protein
MTVGELRDRLVDVPEDCEIETSDNQRVVDLKAHEGVYLVFLELVPGNYHESRLKQR